MTLSKRTTLFATIACVASGISVGAVVGYLTRGGPTTELPRVVSYSFVSPLFLFFPVKHSDDIRILLLGSWIFLVGAALALKKLRTLGLGCTFAASLALGTAWGMIYFDALSA